MDKAKGSIRKYFSKQTLTGISSHIAAKKLIFRHHKLQLNVSIKRMINEFLAYNGAFGTSPYFGAGLEMYFYCNYRDEYDQIWKEENAKENQKWIEKSEIKVCVFRFSGKFDISFFQCDFFITACGDVSCHLSLSESKKETNFENHFLRNLEVIKDSNYA